MAAFLSMVTFVAATTAALYTTEKAIWHEEHKLLWQCFRKEFRHATILGLLQIGFAALIIMDILLINAVHVPWIVLMVITLVSLFILFWMQLWFGYLSRFTDTTKVLLSNTFRMTMDSAPKALLLALLSIGATGAAALCILIFSPLLLLISGIYVMLVFKLQCWILGKYVPKDAKSQSDC